MKRITSIGCIPILAAILIVSGSFNSTTRNTNDLFTGAWYTQNAGISVTWVFIDGYAVMTTYDKDNQKFIMSSGGPYSVIDGQVKITLEFNTWDSMAVGSVSSPKFTINGNELTEEALHIKNIYKRLDNGTGPLAGVWYIAGRLENGQVNERQLGPRRTLTLQHPKLHPIIHDNFLDYTTVKSIIAAQDACLWCLGISQTQVSKEQYHVITHDYAVAAGHAMFQANPNITFLFLSGDGADPTGKSRTLFARVKGKTENALQNLHFENFYIARPGGIRPINKNPNTAFLYKLFIVLFCFCHYFFHFGDHTLHHSFDTCFQRDHGRWAAGAASL